MKVITYFDSERQSYWLNEIKKGDWGAAGFLYELLSKGTFFETVGEGSNTKHRKLRSLKWRIRYAVFRYRQRKDL